MNDIALQFAAPAVAPIYRATEFFLARQPILDRRERLVAYELLFRSADDGEANVTNDVFATASVIAHASDLGLQHVLGSSLGFVNVDAAVLLSDFIRFLPKEKIVLELLETVEATDLVLARMSSLRREGYRFALDDVVVNSPAVQALLPLAEIVKLDLGKLDDDMLAHLCRHFKQAGKMVLAEKVENRQQFDRCAELGCDYFQGFHFARPLVLKGHRLSPSQLSVMQLFAQISAEAPDNVLARSFKQDPALGVALLRLMNRRVPRDEGGGGIESIAQAVAALDRCQLQRWLQVLLYAEPNMPGGGPAPLLILAATRGRLLELMAEKIRPGQRSIADIAFTVGMLSLTDALFGLPLEAVLQRIEVSDEVRTALLERRGLYGEMLSLAESVERVKEAGPLVPPLLKKFGLSSEHLNALQLAAFQWSNALSQEAE